MTWRGYLDNCTYWMYNYLVIYIVLYLLFRSITVKRDFLSFITLTLCIAFTLVSCTVPSPYPESDTADQTIETVLIPASDNTGIDTFPAEEVKVISMNLLVPDRKTPVTLDGRDEIMPPLLLSYDPDSIGIQESFGWTDVLGESLVGYARTGYASNGEIDAYDWTGGNYIYYKADKYQLLDSGTFWLADYTDLPMHESHTCSWAILQNRITGFTYVHMNTHLVSGNAELNAVQMPIVRDMMRRFINMGFPVFLTGDFNTSQGSDTYLTMTQDEFIEDSKLVAEKSMNMGSYNGRNPNRDLTGAMPIDFCFVSKDRMTVHEYEVISTYVDGRFASDHNGIFVRATVNSLPNPYELTADLSANGITIGEISVRSYVIDLTFTQASELFDVSFYRITATDNSENVVSVCEIPSRNTYADVPEVLSCTVTGLLPDTEYTVSVTPTTVIGTYGESISFKITTPPLN